MHSIHIKPFPLFSIIVFCFITLQVQAQVAKSIKRTNGAPSIIRFNSRNQLLTTGQSLKVLNDYLGVDPSDRFQMVDASTDRVGYRHEKYQQFYKGIKVEYGVYVVHSKNSFIQSLSGEYYQVQDLPVEPTLSENEARQRALRSVEEPRKDVGPDKDFKLHEAAKVSKGELLICPKLRQQKRGEPVVMALAYKFDIYVSRPLSRTLIYVDAHTGDIIHKNPLIKHTEGSAMTRYSGSRNIETSAHTDGFILQDLTRGAEIHTFNMKNRTSHEIAEEFSDADNHWTTAEHDNAKRDNAALDAHWGSMMVYDYFFNKHGRNSFDGKGGAIKNYVHYSAEYNNAFWDGEYMFFGDGDGVLFDPLTSLDVIAHEFGHGLCQHTANLNYYDEAGALNEGLSDIWACTIEHFTAPEKDNWLIAEAVVKQMPAIRSMIDPNSLGHPDTYLGKYWGTSDSDFGNVHTNSGVLNYWYYLLTVGKSGTNDNGEPYSVTGIGMEKAAEIVYRTESVYLTSNSRYTDAREFSIQAATDLYGANSNEVTQTIHAWNAVGVYEIISAPSDLTATIASATSVTLHWQDNSTDETGFKIERSASGIDFELVARIGANITSYTHAGLPSDAFIYYRVKAIKDHALSAASNEVKVILGDPPPTVPTADSLALVALFTNANGVNWTNNSRWLSGQVNTWFGVTVENGRLTHLNLTYNNLEGSIPDALGNATALKQLNLADNLLDGDIPSTLGNLTSLEILDLYYNQLTGSIPAELGNLIALQKLILASNKLNGDIPSTLGNLTAVSTFSLWDNELTGEVPDLVNLTGLQELMLSVNQLTGDIPAWLGNLTALKSLYLSSNKLTGTIPVSLANLTSLEVLALSDNQLTGSIPPEIGNLTKLYRLTLSFNNFSGSIPKSLGNLTGLYRLALRYNQLSGEIPEELGNLSMCYELYLSKNKLSGKIPDELGNLSQLQTFDLSMNELTGEIPVNLGRLRGLIELSLSHNRLTGNIPDALSDLKILGVLYLAGNELTGSIPVGVADGPKMRELDLAFNRFTSLPQLLPHKTHLQVHHNQLTFESLEINFSKFYSPIYYSPQDSVGTASNLELLTGQSLSLSALIGGSYNLYQWTKDGVDIPGEETSSLIITSPGAYGCRITNTVVTGLTLHRRRILVTANSKQSQTIEFLPLQARTYGDPPFMLLATASSGLPVSYESSSTLKATIDGSMATILGSGSVTITASQAGDSNYNPAAIVLQSFCINPTKPEITVDFTNSEAPILSSNVTTGNQWYKDDIAIDGATESTLIALTPGTYNVTTSVDNCTSAFSDAASVTITDVTQIESYVTRLYPNPADRKVEIIFSEASEKEIEIMSIHGIAIYRSTTMDNAEIDVTDFAAGLYIVSIRSQKGVENLRFVKR